MNREDIIRMAIESQLMTTGNRGGMYEDAICEFAHLVAAYEREACAKLCDELQEHWLEHPAPKRPGYDCAETIRARSEK